MTDWGTKTSTALLRWAAAPVVTAPGITGFRHWKFWAVLAGYAGAFLVFAHDPFFLKNGAFSYQQGMVTLVLAFVIVAALAWELVILGAPRGANLLLQFLLCLPAFLFIARITAAPSAPPEEVTLWSAAGAGMRVVLEQLGVTRILEYIPYWIRDIFANFKITLFFMVVLGALSFRKLSIKLSALLLLLTAAWLAAFAADAGQAWYLCVGTVLLLAGVSLQFCRFDQVIFYEHVIERLSSAPVDAPVLRCVLKLSRRAHEEGRVAEKELYQIVKDEYAAWHEYSRLELQCIASAITDRMIYDYRIVHLQGNHQGLFLVPEPRLCRCDHLLGALAVWPRVVFTLLVAVVWVLLPIDLIPDAIPFIGMLDDVTVSLLAAMVVKNAMER